ncbi:hypothetical protein CesoFtcFv8_006991 [Champsocephalus esox]|uniref:Uncharacterized protein n=1 Tax=Champsocephalus esox TaxID=159716 RepID=A0AAN8CHP2_9TELE|nr:hypothetical protein CesoFtcFv8_006991 [Champsocephalus esox]
MSSPGSARSARQRQRGFGVSEGRIDRKRKSESSSRRRTNPEFTSSPFRRPVNGPAERKASHSPPGLRRGRRLRGGKLLSVTHGPTKEEKPVGFLACDARGLAPRPALVIAFY